LKDVVLKVMFVRLSGVEMYSRSLEIAYDFAQADFSNVVK
jgi:hypothetical protein